MSVALTTNERKAMVDNATEAVAEWGDALYGLLRRAGVSEFAFVPDTGLKFLISRCLADTSVRASSLTTEEEGVALLAGSDLGGGRGVLLMQSSGVGNCVNALSLTKGGHFPLLMIVSMRGDFGEANPWQYPMGQAAQPVLEAMGVICLRIDTPQDVVPTTKAALDMTFQAGYAVAVLLGQRLLGAKAYEADHP
jgi:sulfopyruvate decarboxylase alpha subunit